MNWIRSLVVCACVAECTAVQASVLLPPPVISAITAVHVDHGRALYAEATAALAAKDAESAPLTLSGVTPGTYSFIVDLDVYNTSNVYQGSEEATITVELQESDITDCAATYEYEVPVRTGERVEFVGARDLEAA